MTQKLTNKVAKAAFTDPSSNKGSINLSQVGVFARSIPIIPSRYIDERSQEDFADMRVAVASYNPHNQFNLTVLKRGTITCETQRFDIVVNLKPLLRDVGLSCFLSEGDHSSANSMVFTDSAISFNGAIYVFGNKVIAVASGGPEARIYCAAADGNVPIKAYIIDLCNQDSPAAYFTNGRSIITITPGAVALASLPKNRPALEAPKFQKGDKGTLLLTDEKTSVTVFFEQALPSMVSFRYKE